MQIKTFNEKQKNKNPKQEYQANLNHQLESQSQFLHKLMITESQEK